jgi:hypothetical protein
LIEVASLVDSQRSICDATDLNRRRGFRRYE